MLFRRWLFERDTFSRLFGEPECPKTLHVFADVRVVGDMLDNWFLAIKGSLGISLSEIAAVFVGHDDRIGYGVVLSNNLRWELAWKQPISLTMCNHGKCCAFARTSQRDRLGSSSGERFLGFTVRVSLWPSGQVNIIRSAPSSIGDSANVFIGLPTFRARRGGSV